MKKIILFLIRMYQLGISPWMGNHCRFHPSCSEYAKASIEQSGVFLGIVSSFGRLLRCHPFHPGGYDAGKLIK